MEKAELKSFRLGLEWSCVLACIIALVQGAGSLRPWSVGVLAVLGAGIATTAIFEHGWCKGSSKFKTLGRWSAFLITIWGVMGFLAFFVWPLSEETKKPGQVEIFLGNSARGREVPPEKCRPDLAGAPGKEDLILVQSVDYRDKEQHQTVFLRNVGDAPIRNVRVTIMATRDIQAFTLPEKFVSGSEVEYDASAIKPYNWTGQDLAWTVRFVPLKGLDIMPLMVSVEGDTLAEKHCELIYEGTFPIDLGH